MQPKVHVTKKGQVKKSCPPGYRLFKGTCMKMPAMEVKRRREGARKARQNRGPSKPRRPPGGTA